MELTIEVRDWEKETTVGHQTLIGNWGEPAFRAYVYHFLKYLTTHSLKTNEEIEKAGGNIVI